LRNLVRQVIRDHKAADNPLPRNQEVPADHTPVQEQVLRKLDEERLDQAVAELAEPERMLFRLKYSDNLPYEAIAQTLGQNATKEALAKLRQRVHRLVKKLQAGIALLEVVEPLPPHYRKVLCAWHFRGGSPETIAEEMGCSATVVRRWLAEAKKRLPAAWGDHQ
jgi:DNA-directed RNA polymerase specialized sigma24 family protein